MSSEIKKKSNRRFERVKALNVLYHLEMSPEHQDKPSFSEEEIDSLAEIYEIPKDSFAWRLVEIALRSYEDVQKALLNYIESFRWQSLPPLERAILRLGALQILKAEELDNLPVEVAIDETVELAKRYSYKNFYKFVNAILDKIAKSLKEEVGKAKGEQERGWDG